MNIPPLILASGSPRRKELLKLLALPFQIQTADIDETPRPEEKPIALVTRLSYEKAQAVASRFPEAVVIAADTVVVLHEQILGKPQSPAQAVAMLNQLRGSSHQVYTAVTVSSACLEKQRTLLSESIVTMRNYAQAEITAYVNSGDPLDKAGAYAIQHAGFSPVAHYSGCYAGIMGLPLGELTQALSQFGIVCKGSAEKCSAYTSQPCCLENLTKL